MPWGLDQHDILALVCAERYHWPEEVTVEQPLQMYLYLPVLWKITADRQRSEAQPDRGAVNGKFR